MLLSLVSPNSAALICVLQLPRTPVVQAGSTPHTNVHSDLDYLPKSRQTGTLQVTFAALCEPGIGLAGTCG